jgi:DNA-binding NarL/FixJ family response regulator
VTRAGRIPFASERAASWLKNGGVLGSLTAEETTVLRWMSYGKKDKEIAELEKMKLGTVKRCVKRIFDKLGVYSRAGAAAACQRLVSEREE